MGILFSALPNPRDYENHGTADNHHHRGHEGDASNGTVKVGELTREPVRCMNSSKENRNQRECGENKRQMSRGHRAEDIASRSTIRGVRRLFAGRPAIQTMTRRVRDANAQ